MKTKNNIKNLLAIILCLFFVGLIVAAIYFRNDNNQQNNQIADYQVLENAANNGSLDSLLDKPTPYFSLADRNGKIYSSENLIGKNIVLFFNEGLMCYPACWNQIAALGNDANLNTEDVITLSVVVDSKEQWQKAINQMSELVKANIVFDEGGIISSKFNMFKTESSMHYGVLSGHTYVIIDKQGIIRHIFDDPNMALHNNQLVEEIKKLN